MADSYIEVLLRESEEVWYLACYSTGDTVKRPKDIGDPNDKVSLRGLLHLTRH